MSDIDSPVREGEILAGKYKVDRLLGAGGMGVVVAATHLALDQRVALKFLRPEALANAEIVARFAREARAAVKIKSEHVARVIDVGSLATGAPYLVMEYLEGSDLGDAIRGGGALPVPIAVDYMLQACEALAEAHVAGIVHRDLKPANLFLARGGDGKPVVKVLDFGISKLALDDGAMTSTQATMGSPLYMSPEHLRSSKDVDLRTDVWALGIILYEMLTGNVPFRADTMAQLCVKILEEPVPPLRHVRGDVPPQVEAIIGKCMERSRDRRYPNVAELAADLHPFGGSRATHWFEKIDRIVYPNGGPVRAQAPNHGRASMPSASGHTPHPMSGSQPNYAQGYGPPSGHVPHAPHMHQSGHAYAHTAPPQSAPQYAAHFAPPSMPQAVPHTTNFALLQQTNPTATQTNGRGAAIAIAAIVTGLAAAALVFFLTRTGGTDASAAAPQGSSSTQGAVTAGGASSAPAPIVDATPIVSASAPPGRATIRVAVKTEPKDAKIYLDDALLPENPYSVEITPDGAGHKIRVEAKGYAAQSLFVVFDKDVALDVELARDKPGATAPTPINKRPGAYTDF